MTNQPHNYAIPITSQAQIEKQNYMKHYEIILKHETLLLVT